MDYCLQFNEKTSFEMSMIFGFSTNFLQLDKSNTFYFQIHGLLRRYSQIMKTQYYMQIPFDWLRFYAGCLLKSLQAVLCQ